MRNADRLNGKWEQFKGELKQQYGDKNDELMKWADQWH